MERVLEITKGHGTGNDFVLFADPDGTLDLTPSEVVALTDRHTGVGADGVLRAVRTGAMDAGTRRLLEERADGTPEPEWFMDYRNADGSIAEMCGNGIRVFVAYLEDAGLASVDAEEGIAIGTRAGTKLVHTAAVGYEADLGPWRLDDVERTVHAAGLPVPRPGIGIDIGNPHVVVALASDDELDRLELHRAPVLDPVAEHGANVEFVVPADPLVFEGAGRIRMRVHERGVGETQSCGTGAVAAALATRYWAGEGAPDVWHVAVPGGDLVVTVVQRGGAEHALLAGPAELVFSSTVAV